MWEEFVMWLLEKTRKCESESGLLEANMSSFGPAWAMAEDASKKVPMQNFVGV